MGILNGRRISDGEITRLPSYQLMTGREKKMVKIVLAAIRNNRVSNGPSMVESAGNDKGRVLVKSDGHNYSYIEQTNNEGNVSQFTNFDEKSMSYPNQEEINNPNIAQASSGSPNVLPFGQQVNYPTNPYFKSNRDSNAA